MSLSTTEPANPFSLYPEPGQTLDKKQIADVVGVSRMRVAQITGTKTAPNPELGEPQKIEGVRGMRWPSESVYRYVLHTGRDACSIPPLVPHPDKARYSLDEERSGVYDLDKKRSEDYGLDEKRPGDYKLETPSQALILVFTEQVETSDPYTIYLGWPLTSSSLDAQELRKFCINSSVLRASATARSIFITFRLPNPGLSAAYVASEYTLGSQQEQWRPTSPLLDFYPKLLACIGLETLPVWRAGDMNAVDAQQWISQGCSAPLRVPCTEPTRNLNALYEYALAQAKSEADEVLAGSWAAMAALIDTGSLKRQRIGYTREYLKGPGPFRWALELTTLEEPPAVPHPSPGHYAALDELAESATLSTLAQTVFNHFGDHRYQKPSTFDLEVLPALWREGIKQLVGARSSAPATYNARFQRLITTHFGEAGGASIPQSACSDAGYLLISDTHYTTMPSLGYSNPQTVTAKDLQGLWPADALEVLIQRNERGQLAAWVRTPAGVLPLPTTYPGAPHPASAFSALTTLAGHENEFRTRTVSPNAAAARVIADIPAGEYRAFDAEGFVAAFA